MNLWALSIIIVVVTAIFCLIVWLFFDHGVDKLRNRNEWKNPGISGERTLYLNLTDKLHIPEKQILRNVYIPNGKGGTSEIDLLVVSKKGIFVFECKNYGGRIYGDMKRKQWIQYIGKKKNHFYNPFLQNQTHCKNLEKFISKYKNIPVVSLVTTIARGEWKIRNLGPKDYFLGYNCHFKDIYESMPICESMSSAFKPILDTLTPLSRPDQKVVEDHINQSHKLG
jgi:hypothetical protein